MFKKIINNVRKGFATNSSSSHSLVYFRSPQGQGMPSKVNGGLGSNEFHQDDFKLTNAVQKVFYVLVQAIGGNYYWNENIDEEELDRNYEDYKDIFPEFSREDFAYAMQGSIDHDSQTNLEKTALKEFVKKAKDPKTVIFGGSDSHSITERLVENEKQGAVKGSSIYYLEKEVTLDEAKKEFEQYNQWR